MRWLATFGTAELGKVVLGTLYGNAIVPKGDAAAAPQGGGEQPGAPS